MDVTSRLLHQIHARYPPVDERVAEILDQIRKTCKDLDLKKCNEDNERQLEQFIARIDAAFPGQAIVQRQRLSKWAVRTTRWNYLFTVPGDSDEQVVLVAHYDTWRGPGADDNTTGEEILKQYLLNDLNAGTRPKLTHVYFFAGSEECGLVELFSQLLLSLGLFAGNFALTYGDWAMLAVAIAPLASYRFGVSGSRSTCVRCPRGAAEDSRGDFGRFSRRRAALHSARDDGRGLHSRPDPIRRLRFAQRPA
jgi:hypothetical protein